MSLKNTLGRKSVKTEQLSIPYFRGLLKTNTEELKSCCKTWEEISSNENVPDDVRDEIRTTVGLTNLLLGQKLKQFGDLIDDSEFKRGEKEINCLDLQGFWDMVYHEVEKIQNSFKNLEKCQKNNWIFVRETLTNVESKKKPKLINAAKVTADSKARALAARQRLAEAKLKMKAQMLHKSENQTETAMDTTNVISNQNLTLDKKAKNESPETISEEETVSAEQPQIKHTLKNIKNLKNSEQKEGSTLDVQTKALNSREINSHHRKQRGGNKTTQKSGKENVSDHKNGSKISKLQIASDEKELAAKPVRSKRAKNTEFIPLQCVTRSAKRAMMAEQNAKN
ncbi:disks large-associated protein 5 [Trichonephila inaurata madagascariensis]|uniref:Disks large-associated protein 5 n=1 Tax=Trichonephila inaurata madagascariensis TaxID=2747483 RepID=A0A8X6WR91_9ARAC|nr:disks large-associated protein 5 [Trichonephila inaurata madagascariensis]